MSIFSAAPQGMGYLYQLRYALLVALINEESRVRIEVLDDIDVSGASGLQMYQLKHRADGTSITDSSGDLWKTLRVWSSLDPSIRNDPLTRFSLVTTAVASPGSAPARLTQAGRDAEAARVLLEGLAKKSQNKELKAAFDAFLGLSELEQRSLLERTTIADGSFDIEEVGKEIFQRLAIAVTREHRPALMERLEGWWFLQCLRHLRGDLEYLDGREVAEKIAMLVQQFSSEALPIDFYDHAPSESEEAALKARRFIYQLKILGVTPKRINNAVLDFYRAYAQRSRWVRDRLLLASELESYENRLEDEWDRLRLALEEEAEKPMVEHAMIDFGKKLLKWMEIEADIRIRPKVSEPYVMRGSFHMLADLDPPRVWWHPEFVSRLAATTGIDE